MHQSVPAHLQERLSRDWIVKHEQVDAVSRCSTTAHHLQVFADIEKRKAVAGQLGIQQQKLKGSNWKRRMKESYHSWFAAFEQPAG